MQFVGDEVFAVFGAPVAADTAADESVRCAVALQGEIATLDERLTDAAPAGALRRRGPPWIGRRRPRRYAEPPSVRRRW